MAGLYIHIPFCGSRCAYCDFYSTTSPGRIAAYLDALKCEMATRCDFLPDGRLDTIYIGGGTPSLLSPEQLHGLLDHAAGLWDCSGVREITLEANPEDLSGEFLRQLRIKNHELRNSINFNRLSIGVQSFDDGLLRLMNRRHSAARAREAVRAAQAAGFGNISIDLIYGIPGMTPVQWERTLDEAVGLGVQHISAYHLTIEPGTAFASNYELRITNYEKAERESESQFAMLREKLGRAGFEHYEISNFALPGVRAIHNSAYWSGAPYLGVGPSAHSFDGGRRREWVAADVEKYMQVFGCPAKSGIGTIYDGETLSDRELANEKIMTALRTADGIHIGDLYRSRHCEPQGRSNPEISGAGLPRADALAMTSRHPMTEKFLRDGLLIRKGDNIAIPPEKFLLSDYIIASLFEAGN